MPAESGVLARSPASRRTCGGTPISLASYNRSLLAAPLVAAIALCAAGCATEAQQCCANACGCGNGSPSAAPPVVNPGPTPPAVQQASFQQASFFQQPAAQNPPEPPQPMPNPPTPPQPLGLQPVRPEELPPAAGAAVEELSLDEVVSMCLMNDPRIRAGLEVVYQANADAVTASLKPNPLLFTDGQLMQLAKDFTPARQGGPPQQDVQVGYPIDWFLFGKRAAAMASASQAIRVTQSEYENLLRERVTKAALAFYDVAEADGLLRLSRQDVETLEQITSNTEKAFAAGGRPQLEVNRLRLALGSSRRTLREAGAASSAARSRLNALVGGTLAYRAYAAKGAFEQPIRMELPPKEVAFGAALTNRPDLMALRWKVEQAQSDAVVEQRKAYPGITMTFGYTKQYQLHTIGFPDADSWSAALAMPLPIWDRNQGNIMAAQSVITQSRFDLQAGELELWSEVESILAELAAARDNATSVSEQDLALAGQILESIRQSYDIGGRTLLELLDAQRNYRDTYRAFTTTRANFWRARTRYQSAIGQQSLP